MSGPARLTGLLAGLLACALAGCGSSRAPRPMPDPWSYLLIGVEPSEEADEVARALIASGHELGRRIEGEGYVAMSFHRPEREEVAIRVVTYRGVALALDSAPSILGGPVGEGRLTLLPAMTADGDVDGDRRPEVLVSERRRGRDCLLIFRIQANGAVEPVDHEARELAPAACVESLEDVDADGLFEAVVPVRLPAEVLGPLVDTEGVAVAPEIPFPLRGDRGRFVVAAPPPSVLDAARRARLAGLAQARATLDPARALGLAVELSLLARAEGVGRGGQVQAFDEALSGLTLDRPLAEAVRRGREEVAGGWPSLAPAAREEEEGAEVGARSAPDAGVRSPR